MGDFLRIFGFGNGEYLKISKTSLNHIVNGEFSIRPLKGDRKSTQTVLKGGLHTYEGWVNFKKLYANELAHLMFFDSRKHRYWYFGRVLGNGVITLRIPRDLFNSKASKVTMYPDEYYKSGYLWKTLFPEGCKEDDILKFIEEALNNIDRESSVKGQIVGFCNIGDPLKEIRLTIQYRGDKIFSAFPSWSQPNTGNDGKPYSHFDSIGFMVAASTEFFDDRVLLESEPVFCFGGEKFGIDKLVQNTPGIFKERSLPSGNVSAWTQNRESELKAFADVSSKSSLEEIFSYLTDIALIKNYPKVLSGAYLSGVSFHGDKAEYNSVIIYQNIIDGLKILYFSFESTKAEIGNVIVFLVENLVSFTLFDLVLKRRILKLILKIVSELSIPSLTERFVLALSKSPVRRELYVEYLPDTLERKKLATPCNLDNDALVLVFNPNLSIKFKLQDYIEILKEQVGETYALNFGDDFLNNYLSEILESQEGDYIKLVTDGLRYLQVSDLASINSYFGDILECLSSHGYKRDCSEALGVIMRDYCRIQFAKRLRINGLYKKYHDYAGQVYEPVDDNLLYGTILKHERWANHFVISNFLDFVQEYAKKVGDKGLNNDTVNFRGKIGKELPPFPIPCR